MADASTENIRPEMSQISEPGDLIERLGSSLGRAPAAQVGALAALLIALIGVADYSTGYDLSFGLFYVAPVSLMAWFGSRRLGVLTAGLSALVWLLANSFTAPAELPRTIVVWNTMIRFGFFGIIGLLVAVSRASHDRERLAARTDQLTGLMNGRAFRDVAEREMLRAGRVGSPVTLLYLDLDNFKNVNDRRGHGAGDEMLVLFARALETAIRGTDVVARLGGDEFVVLLPDTSEEGGARVAAKIHQALADDPRFSTDGVSVSVGAATTEEFPTQVDDLVASADTAMYQAKSIRAIP